MTEMASCGRRRFLRQGARLATAGALPVLALPARASLRGERDLVLVHTHTRERIDLVYAVDERYLPDALQRLNRFLRDHYSGSIGRIDPLLFEQLHRVQQALGNPRGYEVISG
ncbi:MAG TPA: DUF882 domain-containing protein, partial [Rubrivivax sp.]|nr:DUF882 domain-containing protein [Rubrivivax sp.]